MLPEMPYDRELAHRVRELLSEEPGVREQSMFGGLAFLLHGNMAVALTRGGELMVRVGAEAADAALARGHVRQVEMRGRPMTGWVVVAPDGIRTKRQLASWVRRGCELALTLPRKG
jgi:TfoX/Sxy family transcriptional regulator of competence genes